MVGKCVVCCNDTVTERVFVVTFGIEHVLPHNTNLVDGA